jgi:acyl-CoA synthetase (AMP-forming)/AMP-acid ligase II
VARIAILREQEATPERLVEAWSVGATFTLLPERIPLSTKQVDDALGLLPEDYLLDHFVLLTSGSTGMPKFVIGAKRRAEALAEVIHDKQSLADVRETIVALPLIYSYAFVNQFVWGTVLNRPVRLTPGLADGPALVSALAGARDAMLCLTGAQLPLLARAAGQAAFPGIIRLNFAGGRFPQEALATLTTMFPNATVFNNYGCAEALPRLTCRPANAAAEAADIGWVLPGIELRVGTDDALEFRSPFGAVGLVESETFRRVDASDWLATGDLGAPGDGGRWRLLGRRGDVFKRYGEKVSLPSLLGTVLQAWGGEAAFHLDRDRSGEPAHVLTLAPVPSMEQVRTILGAIKKGYPRAAWPLRIIGTAQIPKLPNGKFDLTALSRIDDAVEVWKQHL